MAWRCEEDFEWDSTPLGDLEGVSVVFLCNPNNPTGDSLDRGVVLEIAARVVDAAPFSLSMRPSPTSSRGSASQIWSTEGSGSRGPSQVLRDTRPEARLSGLR